MEEVPDEEPQVRGGVLDEGAGALLVANKEYEGTLKRGQVDTLVPKIRKKRAERTKPPARNIKEELPNELRSGRATKGSSTSSINKELRDRPIPQQTFEWFYDPRMPREWNEMVSSIREHESARQPPAENVFRIADPEEVSKPRRFKHLYRSPEWVERTRISVAASSVLGRDESEDRIRAMRAKFEKPSRKVPHNEAEERLPRPIRHEGKDNVLTEDDFPRLRQQWHDEFADMVNGTRSQLPPWREVNHEIHLMDNDKRYKYFTPRCPNSLRDELHAKINRYVNAGWWEPHSVKQVAPLLCIHKKDGKLRTVVNVGQQNDNTVKDVMPLPDQEVIHEDVARAKYRSKIDLTDAYEQVHIRVKDVEKNAFVTITGTFVSHVMWIGDCNAPAMFQQLMTMIFRDAIGHSMHVYLDNIFIYSDSIEEHEEHLCLMFERLREHQLFFKWAKCDLYAEQVNCLDHTINKDGIHIDTDKVAHIRECATP